jgi:hypothetical protein
VAVLRAGWRALDHARLDLAVAIGADEDALLRLGAKVAIDLPMATVIANDLFARSTW